MRLTQIKLSGFKSFVDPTVINVPGTLVGVVGPNGCGKSNIIDAVRWVLGESRASALRGDSMQDVIFNGSSQRKPVSRASVELIFDNAMGRAAGQWSQYAEISVKRLLGRDGESSYLINNTQVRRRDIHDIFLGTGLGPRAYAIIEQGMISRIIEAKPEEMRVFLEEAAGISKYKERRKETENRLSDTRENLARVEDIRNELGAQIEKLGQQAEVARRFNELSAERQGKQNLLSLIRKREAEAESQRHARDIERLGVEIEAETARLRQLESELETVRQEHYAAGDATGVAQGELYESNTEVARLEAEIRFVSETRGRIQAQLAQISAQHESARRQESELQGAQSMWSERLLATRERLAEIREELSVQQGRLPDVDQAWRDFQRALSESRGVLAEVEQGLQLEQAHIAHATRVIGDLEAREQRLAAERGKLEPTDSVRLDAVGAEVAQAEDDIARQASDLSRMEDARTTVQARRAGASQRLQALERELSALEARRSTLQHIQGQIEENSKANDWIERQGLGSHRRLWQSLRVEPGWETAVEAVLLARIHAIETDSDQALQALLLDVPKARLSVLAAGTAEPAPAGVAPVAGARALAELVDVASGSAASVAVHDWLSGCFAVEQVPDAADRAGLAQGVVLVTREGHQFSRHSASFHAADSTDAGMLARQREIDELATGAADLAAQIDAARAEFAMIDRALTEHEEALAALASAGTALKQRLHELQLESVKLIQADERYRARVAQLDSDAAELASRKAAEFEQRALTEEKLAELRARQEQQRDEVQQAQDRARAAEQDVAAQRERIAQVDRTVQETAFAEREGQSKLEEIARSLGGLADQIAMATEQQETLAAELMELHDEGLGESLQTALEARVQREERLAVARSRQEELATTLRESEELRVSTEQKLGPMRERVGDLRLKEQAARLAFEQYAQQLAESGADEAVIAADYREGQKAAPLQGEITRITNAINDLGPINMAALEELATSQERKQFLDEQSGDLGQALETLENAIRKIDRETRDLLQTTFDTVNEQFGKMFPALFGGGEARLLMSGEEILDAGVQVIARPPGKRNSSIHLLSGGEKALTAIALVFSFFQLNPAPFCLLDEVDAPLDDANTERFCGLVRKMSQQTQFLYISHNKLTMEMATQLIGVTMQEQGVSRVVAVDIDEALRLREDLAA